MIKMTEGRAPRFRQPSHIYRVDGMTESEKTQNSTGLFSVKGVTENEPLDGKDERLLNFAVQTSVTWKER